MKQVLFPQKKKKKKEKNQNQKLETPESFPFN